MHSEKNKNLTYTHITLFLWISWIFVILSLGLMSSWFLNFQIGFYTGAIALLFSITYLIKNYIEHWSERLVLEPSCLTLNRGIIFKRKSQIPYYKINNISIDKFLWIHNISFDTGNDTTNINFHYVSRSDELKEEIENRIEQERHFEATGKVVDKPKFNTSPIENEYANLERQSRSPFPQMQPMPIMRSPLQQPNPQRPAKPNIIDELERLNQLKLQGALSSVEFELAKKRLLMDV
jgi:membrane protein YdbS with pleckstrin-like domain